VAIHTVISFVCVVAGWVLGVRVYGMCGLCDVLSVIASGSVAIHVVIFVKVSVVELCPTFVSFFLEIYKYNSS